MLEEFLDLSGFLNFFDTVKIDLSEDFLLERTDEINPYSIRFSLAL